MAAISGIALTNDTYALFIATRLGVCLATGCRFNTANTDPHTSRVMCSFKMVEINEQGMCMQYEAKDEPTN